MGEATEQQGTSSDAGEKFDYEHDYDYELRARGEKGYWIGLGLVLGLAVVLRWIQIGTLELWLDENYSVVMALWPGGVLRGALTDTNPPLYLFLLKGWMSLFGLSAAAVRSLSAVLGVVQLAVLAAWLRAFGLPRRAALWAVALGALAPLHVYYSQEGRAYTLAWLLLTLAFWSFTSAAASGRWRTWLLHGLLLTLAFYTHNLIVIFIPLFAVAGWVLGLDRRGWLRLAGAYALAGVLYGPWFVYSARAVQAGGVAWIADNWSAAAAPWMIPGSLEILGTGGKIPLIFRMVSPPGWVRVVALGWLAAILGAAVIGRMKQSSFVREQDVSVVPTGLRWGRHVNPALKCWANVCRPCGTEEKPGLWRKVLFLWVLVLGPLVVLLVYSLALRPLYVVGRYDTLVFPALLGLMGLGAWRCEVALRRWIPARMTAALVVFVPLLVALYVFPERMRSLSPEMNVRLHPQEVRGELIKDYYQPGDTIVCLGLEGTRIAYQMLRLGIDAPLLTYPLATRQHMGYFRMREVARDEATLRRDAQAILERVSGKAGEAGDKRGGRVWVVLDRYAFRAIAPGTAVEESAQISDATKIAAVLLEALGGGGFKEWDDAVFRQRARVTGMRIYVPGGR